MPKFLTNITLVLSPIGIWALLATMLPRYLFPSPLQVMQTFLTSWEILILDATITLTESLGGLVVALCISFLASVMFYFNPSLERLGMPYAIAIKSIPVVAMAPLLVLWFGNGMVGKVVLAALICFFPLLVGLSDGFKSLPRELRYLAAVWSQDRGPTFRLLSLPFSVPYLFSALKVAAPLATVGAVVAEFSGADRGLGHAILIAAYRADAELLFAGIIGASLIGLGLFAIVGCLETRFLRKMRIGRVSGTF
ncbi:MAG: ABC transporter permease [bacterium]|uniref:ABC transporter permease n=1 Tax=Candidatus Methylomirabilis tolerans TaxID=3123416 RepID=A0AAJ1EJS0_9BACT|nr:ABC transporter permease [Candidatus Methylomirabilis sp.]